MAVPVVVVSTLDEINAALRDRNITQVDQAGDLKFLLDEQAPIQEVFLISLKAAEGKLGFVLNNPELMRCKNKAKGEMDTAFDNMLGATLRWMDAEITQVAACIGSLKGYEQYSDAQIDAILVSKPELEHRNQGVLTCIYPCPPFLENPMCDYLPGPLNQRVPFQASYATLEQRNAAAARDRRAQKAVWSAKLKLMEAKHSILTQMRADMVAKMWLEFNTTKGGRSDLGVGYANYQLPSLV